MNISIICVAFLLGIQQVFSTQLSTVEKNVDEKAELQNQDRNPLASLILNQNVKDLTNHNLDIKQDTPDSLRRIKRQYGRRYPYPYPYPPVWIGGGFGIGSVNGGRGFGGGFGGRGFGGRGGGFGGRGGGFGGRGGGFGGGGRGGGGRG